MHKQIAIFNKLSAVNIVEIAQYCSNGTVNALVTTCKDVASNDMLTPQFLRYRDLNENTIRVRENFKIDVRELGYGQKIPAYMFDECRVLQGHTSWVEVMIELSNGKLATGSQDNTIRIWDLNKQEGEDGYCRVLEGHTNWVSSVIELSNGKLATGASDSTIRVLDLDKQEGEDGYCRVLEGHTSLVYSVIELRNGKLATGSGDNIIRIWDLDKSEGEEGYCRWLEGHTYGVRSVIELSNGKLVSGSNDKTIRIWGATIDNEETET